MIVTEQPDPVIHQPVRLKIMAALKPLGRGGLIGFQELKALTGTTDGNLGTHIGALEQAGHVEVIKDFVGKRPRTRLRMTESGGRAFEAYVDYLRSIVETAG